MGLGRGSLRILVTGCNGFIGSHLVPALLERGYDVIGMDLKGTFENGNLGSVRNKIQALEADIRQYDSLQRIDVGAVDFVHHLAAIASPGVCNARPNEAYDTNVYGVFNVMRFAKGHNVKKVVFTSSSHVYGISPRYVPTPEIQPVWLQEDTYTSTKIIGEYIVRLFYENYSIPYTTIRLFNCYGPGQTTDYLIPAKIAEGLNTGVIRLRGRLVKKDFVYISDVINAYVRLLESDYVGEMNVGSGVSVTLETVVSHIAKELGVELTFLADNDPVTFMQCDTSRSKKVLGWEAKVPLERGIAMTVESMRRLRGASR